MLLALALAKSATFSRPRSSATCLLDLYNDRQCNSEIAIGFWKMPSCACVFTSSSRVMPGIALSKRSSLAASMPVHSQLRLDLRAIYLRINSKDLRRSASCCTGAHRANRFEANDERLKDDAKGESAIFTVVGNVAFVCHILCGFCPKQWPRRMARERDQTVVAVLASVYRVARALSTAGCCKVAQRTKLAAEQRWRKQLCIKQLWSFPGSV